MSDGGWIAVDLDGTLAHYNGWRGIDHIGDPVPAMQDRVLKWLSLGHDVRIFTARVCEQRDEAERLEALSYIQAWCLKHFGRVLPVTNIKDFGMIELWDDRAVRVQANVGEPCCGHYR